MWLKLHTLRGTFFKIARVFFQQVFDSYTIKMYDFETDMQSVYKTFEY